MPIDRDARRRSAAAVGGMLLLALALSACAALGPEPPPPPAPPRGEPLSAEPASGEDPGPVRNVQEPIVVAAWAEPRRLAPGGGHAQIVVRVQKKGGARFPGVEVRLSASEGSLYSAGRVLVTDSRGMTRDRLTARRSSVITLNAGGTRYRFTVDVGAP